MKKVTFSTQGAGNFLTKKEIQLAEPFVNAADKITPVSDEFYYISPDKCTECKGFHEEPQCAAVCPVDCCVPDPDREETEEARSPQSDPAQGSSTQATECHPAMSQPRSFEDTVSCGTCLR